MTINRSSLPKDPDALRAVLSEKLENGYRKMRTLDIEIAMLKEEIAALREVNRVQDERLIRIEKNTEDVVTIFRAGDGTLKTAKWFGKLLIWIGSLASAIYAIYYAIINWPHKGI